MRNFISMVLLCLIGFITNAQNPANIIVNYDYTSPNKNGKSVTKKMTLLASPKETIYFNDLSLWVDSLKSTPDGNSQYMEILKKSCMEVQPDGSVFWNLSKGPYKTVYTYVFTKNPEESVTLYDKFGEELGYYEEPFSEMEWEIVDDSTSNVLDYECIMAESDYHGRHWRAWFTPEVPLSVGPWKLRGLPGMILKAEADGGFNFTATGIENTGREIPAIYLQEQYSHVDRKKALENAEYFINNEESILNAQGQKVEIYSTDENGNKIKPPKYDGLKHSLEPDYKKK